MIVMTFKLHDSSIIAHLPKWNARIYKGEKFLFTPEFFGATEDEAKLKARKWVGEVSSVEYRERMAELKPADIKPETSDNEGAGRGKHFAGKVWLLNRATGHKCRVEPDQVEGLMQNGYVKAGPRSK